MHEVLSQKHVHLKETLTEVGRPFSFQIIVLFVQGGSVYDMTQD